MSGNIHMEYAYRIADHVSTRFTLLQSNSELMHLSLVVDDCVIDFSSYVAIWEGVKLKIASNNADTFLSVEAPICKIISNIGKAILYCYHNYELNSTFAFYEMCFEILVNIFVLLQNVRDAPNQPPQICNPSRTVMKNVSNHMLQVLEDIEEVYDDLLTEIPNEEYMNPGISGNLRLYMLEIIVEIFGAESVKGRDLMDLTSNDIRGCVSLISFVIGHDGAPFRVQQAAAKALVELTFAETVFLSGVAASIASGDENKNMKISRELQEAVDSLSGNADLNSQSMAKLTGLLKVHVNHLIPAIIQYDVINAFTRCICIHQQSHKRTDILVKSLLTTIHNCLLYCSVHADKLRRHLGTQSGIIPTILLPYIDNLLPALQEISLKSIANAKERDAAVSEGANSLPAIVRAGRDIATSLEWQNYKSTLQSLVVATYSVPAIANEVVLSGVLARICNSDPNLIPLYVGDISLLEALVKLLLNTRFASDKRTPPDQVNAISEGISAIRTQLLDRDASRLRDRLLSPGSVSASAVQAQPWRLLAEDDCCEVTIKILAPLLMRSQESVAASAHAAPSEVASTIRAAVVATDGVISGSNNTLLKHSVERETTQLSEITKIAQKNGFSKDAPSILASVDNIISIPSASSVSSDNVKDVVDELPVASTVLQNVPSSATKKSVHQAASSAADRSILDAPTEFLCTLDGKLMTDPVRGGSSEFVFERSTLEKWFNRCGQVCPVSGEPMLRDDLITDDKLKTKIQEWLAERIVKTN